MLSIIQGVALTDLSQITFSEHAHFTVVNWVEVATMLWSLIYIWNHFMSDALMTHWIPDLEDASGGWPRILANLKSLLETDEVVLKPSSGAA
jgi:hypothetical protein